MKIILLLAIVWAVGFLITVLHEIAHVILSGGTLQSIQIGLATKYGIQINRFLTIYPLLPIAGYSHIILYSRPSTFRLVGFVLVGSLVGLSAAILCVVAGFNLLQPEALAEFYQTWKLGFLLRDILHGTAGIQSTVGTGFIAAGILYGIQQAGNLLPVPGFDGYQAMHAIRNKRG